MRTKSFLVFLIFSFIVSGLSAQKSNTKISIKGTVLDGANEPIVHAIIMVDGKKTDNFTDYDGHYKVKVDTSAKTIGIFTFGNGFCEDLIDGRTRIDFTFKTIAGNSGNQRLSGLTIMDPNNIPKGEESVEIGYGHIKKKYITTDITFIDCTERRYIRYNSILNIIQNEVSGVMVMGSAVVIQGSRNMGGWVPALIITDGVAGGSLDIPPSQVESISVLKGTAAAIYGSRGYGGVIIIKTRMGND